jgi:transcriptional regulator with XRE-family HTH domain
MSNGDDLGAFLRARRAALTPADVGLPQGRGRRTPGLRREEIAMLAGVSVTWYTWLEQGRRINASADVLQALARALRLDDTGRKHLLALAARTPTAPVDHLDHAPDALVRLLAALEPAPAYVLGPRWEFLAWNRAQALLYPPLERLDDANRNLLWVLFGEPAVRTLIVDWEDQARRSLAEFRAATAPLRNDPAVVSLVERLRTESTEFETWWLQADVAGFRTRVRHYDHPRAGRLAFEFQQLLPGEWPGLQVVCQLGLPGDDSVDRLNAWREIA